MSCIIVGRCADVVLADRKDVLNIRIYAPYEARLRNCVTQLEMDERTARKMIDRVDKSREQYHREYGGVEPEDYSDLMLNSARYTVEEAADTLCRIVRHRFGL